MVAMSFTHPVVFSPAGPPSLAWMLQLQPGGFNPSEKYARQIGLFPQVGMKIKHI